MKITFEKGMCVYKAKRIFEDFIRSDVEDYPLLKNNMTINITLKNDINEINPRNEINYYFDESSYEYIDDEKKEDASYRLEEEWEEFLSEYKLRRLTKEIESDRKYIETATEKSRKQANIDKRKSYLLEHETELVNEKNRLQFLEKFSDYKKNGKVKYEYKEYYPGYWPKEMIFEMEETYIFLCDPQVHGSGELRKKDSESKFEYLIV